MYRQSMVGKPPTPAPRSGVLVQMLRTILLLGYFTLLPALLCVGIHWVAYALTANSLYQEGWMMPGCLLASVFLAGALMRQVMEDAQGRMGLFVVGVLALGLFSWLTHLDIQGHGGIYSQWMPSPLRSDMQPWLMLLPGVGLLGMLMFKYVALKNYG